MSWGNLLKTNNMKKCICCKEVKSEESFEKKVKNPDGLSGNCRSCLKVKRAVRRKLKLDADPDHYKKACKRIRVNRVMSDPYYYRRKMIRQKYGLTLEQYDELLIETGGKCTICKVKQSDLTKPLFVDHDHVTGKVRGLLCIKCNTAIGFFKDNPILLKRAINYLKQKI